MKASPQVLGFRCGTLLLGALALGSVHSAPSADSEPIDPAPSAQSWTALAKLPDWSGVWTPLILDQIAQEQTNPAPWKPEIAKQIAAMYAEEKAGRPFPVIDHCFPTGMPSYMLITHNAFEILFSSGRVTLLGEGDGNRMRRIYTDGRPHPADPDPTFHGHSIGHWEGSTLVVDTVGLLPQVYLAVNEAVGVPNNGDMHIVERLHLQDANTLYDELQISANKLLTKPWKTTRKYSRQRLQKFEITEGECEQGGYIEGLDKYGNSIYVPIKMHDGVPVGSDSK